MGEGESGDYSREAYEQAEQEGRAAEVKKAGIIEANWDEALKLNKKYDELWEQKEQAEQNAVDFRREKLGMAEEKEAGEEEKKEPTLEEWATVYTEMQGVDVAKILEAFQSLYSEMTGDERRELTMPVYCKEGVTAAEAWEIIRKENPAQQSFSPDEIVPRQDKKAFVVFARFSQEADGNSLGENAKSAEDWEQTGNKFMSPKTAMIAREAFRRLTGKQMDLKCSTMDPCSRNRIRMVPYLTFFTHSVGLRDTEPDHCSPRLGVRRIVYKELES